MTRITGTLCADMCTYVIISGSVIVKTRNISGNFCRENQNIHFSLCRCFTKTVLFFK